MDDFLKIQFVQIAVKEYRIGLVVYDPEKEVVVEMVDLKKNIGKTIQEVIKRYDRERPLPKDVEGQLIFDTERDHYQLINVRWNSVDTAKRKRK